jgi:nucleotide-binding universal stress UspA family protein
MIVLVAIDGSHTAMHALDTVLTFANELKNEPEIHCVSALGYVRLPGGLTNAPATAPDLLASEAETALAVATERAAGAGRAIQSHVVSGDEVESILQLAHEIKAQLIVTGTHGRKGLQRAVLGSTCEGIIRSSDIPVLAIRKP